MRGSLAFLMLLLLARSGALAQSAGPSTPLTGLKSVQLVVEYLGDDSKTCGLDMEALGNAVTYPISTSRLKLKPKSSAPALYVQVITVYNKSGNLCASSYMLEVYDFQSVILEQTGIYSSVKLTLWAEDGVGVSDKARHRSDIISTLEELAKRLVVDWNAAQLR
jgi:hypothetical protein